MGLAKELDPLQKVESGLYNMSGGTGSRRFMAPEVSLSEPYGLSADLYSFGILLWELLTLEKAFARMPVDEHRERVIRNNERPEKDPSWSASLQEIFGKCDGDDLVCQPVLHPSLHLSGILTQVCRHVYLTFLDGCWNRNPLQRPPARDVYKALRQEVQSIVADEFPKQAAEEERRRNMGLNRN